MSRLNRLPDDQVLALYVWKRHHGRYWRANLRNAWMTGKYGRIDTDTAAALQRMRNTAFGSINDVTETDLNTRVHHIQLARAAQTVVSRLQNVVPDAALNDFVHLEGLLQEAPAHYDRDL